MRVSNKRIVFDIHSKADQLYFVGDIHGNFVAMADDLVNSCKIRDCVVIALGDCGFGFFSKKKMEEYFQKMQTMLSPYGIYVIFFRGNHDDPSWFKYQDDEFAVNYPNLYIAEDFTIVDFHNYNVLLWGGGISIDRSQRVKNTSYWEDEFVKPLPKEFDFEMYDSENNLDIHCVCTHSAPDFCLPVTTTGIEHFFSVDKMLEFDVNEERTTISKGAYILKRNNPNLCLWVYGHYHDTFFNSWQMNEEISKFKGIRFIGLDMFREKHSREQTNQYHYNMYNRQHKNDLLCAVDYR